MWKWQVKRKTTEFRAFSWSSFRENASHLSEIPLSMSLPRVLPFDTSLSRLIRKQVLNVLGFAPIWTLIGWFNTSAPGGQIQQTLTLLPVGERQWKLTRSSSYGRRVHLIVRTQPPSATIEVNSLTEIVAFEVTFVTVDAGQGGACPMVVSL